MNFKFKDKKGMGIHDMLPAIVIVVIIILTAAFSSSILASIQSSQTTNSAAYNTTGYGLTTLTGMMQQMPNIGLIIVVAVIIGILVGSFLVYQGRKQ